MAEGRATGAGLAGWSIRHPVGVNMIALALVVLGLVAAERLPVDLLPHIIYPEIRVRVLDPGVPARIMEDRVTRQLEEQLAITEGAVGVRSRSIEGASSVDLSFPYGTDLDAALRDASARLDRAKRFLPDSIEPPIIYKLDPAQIPVAEFAVSSPTRSPAELRAWVDERFGKWFVNLPGVAAVEVGAHPFPALPHVAGLHGTVGWLLSRVGWVLLFTDRGTSLLLLIWMAESLLFLLVAERLHSRLARLGGHALLALTGAGVLAHMFDEGVRPLEFSVLVDLTFVLFMAGLTWWKRPTLEGAVYEAVAHGGALIWLAREMSVLEWKPGGITVAWAAYATVAYGAALLRRDHRLYWAALVVLALVGGKLVLVDAARLSALWRAVLFMAIGVLYIFLAFVGWRALARTAWREEV